jgi:PadR family transcriptional regulator, regulatory protein AphA
MEAIQLTPTSYIVLGLLRAAGEATPYELKQMMAATVGYFFGVPHSQVYAEPARLARAGLLTETQERTGRRRKRYSLTERGRQELDEWIETPTDELYELRDPGLLKLGAGTDPKKLAPVQLEAHKRRLAELESIEARMKVSGGAEAQRLVLEAGIGHEREYVRFWSEIVAGGRKPKRG